MSEDYAVAELKNWRWAIIMAGLIIITLIGPGATACRYFNLQACETVAGVEGVDSLTLDRACTLGR